LPKKHIARILTYINMAGLDVSIRSAVGIATNNPADGDLVGTIAGIANVLIGLIVIISVFFIFKGAIEWMQGNDKNEAQQTITNAVIGVIVSILAFFIVRLFTGGSSFLITLFK
jgi:uncharacterized protein YqgC (DUF456 family)